MAVDINILDSILFYILFYSHHNSHPHLLSHGLDLQQLINNRIVVTSRTSITANHVNYATNGGTNMSPTHINYHNPNNILPRVECKAALEAALLDMVN